MDYCPVNKNYNSENNGKFWIKQKTPYIKDNINHIQFKKHIKNLGISQFV